MVESDISRASDLLGDGRLIKKLLRAGTGDCPKVGDQVSIHYEWYCNDASDDPEVLDSSRERGEPFVFELGAHDAILGWEHAVASMKVGERASLTLHPDLVYGDAGCGGGAIPGFGAQTDSSLQCNVELLQSAAPDVVVENLSTEERLQVAMRAKDAGNVHFKAGELEAASRKYEEALRFLAADDEEEEVIWQDEVQKEARSKTNLACNLNIAQCELKLGRYIEAFGHAAAAVQLDPSSAKAIYRRGLAAMHSGLLDQARSDLLEAARREPSNSEIRTQLQACQAKLQASNAKDRNAFGGMFDKANQKRPKMEESSAPVSQSQS